MPGYYEIRADYDRTTVVVYQAFNDAIADAALEAQRFVPPFSVGRMTWIKPSFLWLMERSGWSTKCNQERILAVRILRSGWEQALSVAELTAFNPRVHKSVDTWRTAFGAATVHVQWDPERSHQGTKLDFRAIQVGLSRVVIGDYVDNWITEIKDLTPLVAKMRRLRKEGEYAAVKKLLPAARVYPLSADIAARLGMT